MIASHTQPSEGVGMAGRGQEGKQLTYFFIGGIYMQDFINIIQGVGFPIACCIAMFIMLQNEQKAHKEESQQIRTL